VGLERTERRLKIRSKKSRYGRGEGGGERLVPVVNGGGRKSHIGDMRKGSAKKETSHIKKGISEGEMAKKEKV